MLLRLPCSEAASVTVITLFHYEVRTRSPMLYDGITLLFLYALWMYLPGIIRDQKAVGNLPPGRPLACPLATFPLLRYVTMFSALGR